MKFAITLLAVHRLAILEKCGPGNAKNITNIKSIWTPRGPKSKWSWSRYCGRAASEKALTYSSKRLVTFAHYLFVGQVPAANEWCANQIHLAELGTSNRFFSGALGVGQPLARFIGVEIKSELNSVSQAGLKKPAPAPGIDADWERP